MNFKDLLKLTEESRTKADSFRTTGEATQKERAKSSAPDAKAKDAARKRIERSKKLPRERMPKEQLIREVIAVRTASGRVQLIFKDSFNKNVHTKINRGDTLTMEEARSFTQEDGFEQTGASKLLFGDVKTKEPTDKRVAKKGEEGEEKEAEAEAEPEPLEKPEKRAKRLSPEEIFDLMSQMGPEQLAQMPFEVRQQYFKQVRNPPSNVDFDNASFETLSTKFGINPISSVPYNQQVLNALVFLAKIKSGASEQELGTYTALAPSALEFTKNAFLQAKKILSQIGEQCIQNLISTIENGSKSTFSEGGVDMECGNYKFKMSVGGEVSLTTDKFNQEGKGIRGIIATAINQTLNNPETINDPKVKEFISTSGQVGSKFGQKLINQQTFSSLKNSPDVIEQLKQTMVFGENGQALGPYVDSKGNLNKFASFENYEKEITKDASSLFKSSKDKPNGFASNFVKTVLKMFYRGDGIKQPEFAPTHMITQNGVFPMTDAYFDEISKTAVLTMNNVKPLISAANIESGKKKPSERLAQFATVVEETQKQKEPDIFIDRSNINPLQLAMASISQSMEFDINASLLPGFSPKDLNAIQYNIVRIGKKTVRIPVERNDTVTNEIMAESHILVNDILVESLTNNFVLNTLLASRLMTKDEAISITSENFLLESANPIRAIYERVLTRVNKNPEMLIAVLNKYNSYLYEKYVRDYKMEYRNYHGKAKQRKERAKRTAARENLIKKGRVKKGDGKDIDHKKPLRSGGSNGINNLRIRNKSENRADNGHKKGEKQNKDWK